MSTEYKSQWRVDFENYLAESRKVKPKTRKQPVSRPKHVRAVSKRFCANACGRTLCARNTSGLCLICVGVTRRKAVEEKKTCILCPATLNANNTTNHCKKCWNRIRRQVKMGPKPKCSCGKEINRDNAIGKCRSCSMPHYRKKWRAKQ